MDLSAKKRTLYLDVARVAAIVSISLNHAVNRTFQNYQGQQEEFLAIPLASSVVKVLFTIFSKLGVPLFLMISGALLLNKRMDGPEDVKKFYKHNLLPLLITAEIWYAIMYWCRLIAGVGDLSLSQIGLGPALLALITFAGICGYQLFAYAQPLDYLVDYNFPLLPVCAAFLFEWIRRKSHRLQRFRRPICYIARISLGIYFVHILVMTGMSWVLGDWGRTTLWRLLVLEAGSVGLSVAAIALMSRSRLARKYLFLIK